MKRQLLTRCSNALHRRGFALVVSLSMLVLLTLIAVGLLSLSAITLRTTSQGAAMAEAQANARLALMIAISELQKQTGPDTRVTAPANLVDENYPPLLGVWRSWEGTNHDTSGRPIAPAYNSKNQQDGSGGRFIDWLVSRPGNATSVNVGDAPSLVRISPGSDTVPLLAAGSLAPGDVRQVHVVPTRLAKGGSFAWWVSGENQKAKLAQPYSPRTRDLAGFAEMGQSHAVIDPEVFGLSPLLNDREDFIATTGNAKPGSRAITLATTELIADGNTVLPHLKFHDLSTTAVGLLTNTATGGWRKDLSVLSEKWDNIYAAYPGGRLPLFRISPASGATTQVVKPTVANHSPNNSTFYPWSSYSQLGTQRWPNTWHSASASWQSLVNFATSYKGFNYSRGVAESPFVWSPVMKWRWQGNPNDATNQEFFDNNHKPRLHPIIARFQFLVYLRAYPDAARPGRYGLEMLYSPVVTMWNPYNVRLSIDNPGPPSYGVVIGGQRSFPGAFAAEPRTSFPNGPATIPSNRHRMLTNGNFQYADTNGNFNNEYDNFLSQNFIYQMSGTRAATWTDLRTWGVNLPTGQLSFEPGEVRMFSANGDSESRFGGAAFDTDSGYAPGAPSGVPITIRNGNVGPNDFFWFSLKGAVHTQPFRFRSPGRGFHIAYGLNTGASYTGGSLYNGVSQEMISSTALTNAGRAAVYWPDQDFEPHGFTVAEIASVPAMPIYSITLGPRFTIGTGAGSANSRPTKGFLQSDPLAGISLVDPGVDNANSHPANGNFEISYNTLTFGSSLTPNLSDREGFIVTGFQSGDGISRLITHELPLRPMASLLELQAWNPRGKNPMPPFQSHLIGNSDASPMIPKNRIVPSAMASSSPGSNFQHDDAYCANHLLFDDFFFSSVAPQPVNFGGQISRNIETVYRDFLTGKSPLTNRAYKPVGLSKNATTGEVTAKVNEILNNPRGDGWQKIASNIQVDGMFNVNSTSVDAWKAILGHAKNLGEIPYHGQNGMNLLPDNDARPHAVTRSSLAPDVEAGGDANSEVTGFRRLTDDQIEELAENIVEEVRARGPFLSLSEFVNRQLSENEDLALAGAVQSALNNLANDPMRVLRDDNTFDQTMASKAEEGSAVDDTRLNGVGYEFEAAALGSSMHGAPGWIRQADILRPIAPVISVRDDTFTIRAYGDARDSAGKVLARAWCEATLQRHRDFVDNADAADATDPPSSGTNRKYGRKYQIVAFRWLHKDEV